MPHYDKSHVLMRGIGPRNHLLAKTTVVQPGDDDREIGRIASDISTGCALRGKGGDGSVVTRNGSRRL
jgi:hypothetical protein